MPATPVPILAPVALFGISAVLSWILSAVMIRVAPRLGLLDHPAERKVHTFPTPKGGGLAIFAALAITWPLLGFGLDWTMEILGLGAVIVALGFIDDRQPLAWQVRLLVQLGVAAGLVWMRFGGQGWVLGVSSVLWVVCLINAFNMLDNMDMSSGGVAWIASGMLALAWFLGHEPEPETLKPASSMLVLMGALTGFLWYNRPPARLFMGDAGSTFLGYFLGVGTLQLWSSSRAVSWEWTVPLCILAVPLYDITTVLVLRLWQGRSPFHADKQHLSHRLAEMGLGKRGAVRLIHLFALASGAAGVLLYYVPEPGAVIVETAVGCFWIGLAILEVGHGLSVAKNK